VPEEVRFKIEFTLVVHINEVLAKALNLDLNQWNEDSIYGQNDSDIHGGKTLHGQA